MDTAEISERRSIEVLRNCLRFEFCMEFGVFGNLHSLSEISIQIAYNGLARRRSQSFSMQKFSESNYIGASLQSLARVFGQTLRWLKLFSELRKI